MGRTHGIRGINHLPIYLISSQKPWVVDEDDYIDDVPLTELLSRLKPGEHLYLVDYASNPGTVQLTLLA